MPLVIPLGSGNGTGYIRYKPQENAWLMSSSDGPVEFEWDSPVVIDIEKVELGWLNLGPGIRDWIPWPENKKDSVEKPTDGEYKPGAKLFFFSKKIFGDDDPIRELCSSQVGVLMFVQALHAAGEPSFDKGCPVVDIDGATATKIGKGSTRIPQFTIKRFVKRPSELLENGKDTSVPEPEVQSVSEPSDDDEF